MCPSDAVCFSSYVTIECITTRRNDIVDAETVCYMQVKEEMVVVVVVVVRNQGLRF